MENNKISSEIKENSLYQYSKISLVDFMKEKINDDKNNMNDTNLKRKKEFLINISSFLEEKLRDNIRLHLNGFNVYKQKLLSEKNLIQNSLKKDIRNLTINQLLELLIKIKNNSENKESNEFFNIGKNMKNNHFSSNNNIDINSIENLNKIFSNTNLNNDNINNINNECLNEINQVNNNNINVINNNIKFRGFGIGNIKDPRQVYHSPSPITSKRPESIIIKENKGINNHIDFEEEQKINNF